MSTTNPPPVAVTTGVPSDVWAAFHKRWTDAVGTPGYDKRLWRAQEAALIERYAGTGHAPKVTT